jgi:hypothetical protein
MIYSPETETCYQNWFSNHNYINYVILTSSSHPTCPVFLVLAPVVPALEEHWLLIFPASWGAGPSLAPFPQADPISLRSQAIAHSHVGHSIHYLVSIAKEVSDILWAFPKELPVTFRLFWNGFQKFLDAFLNVSLDKFEHFTTQFLSPPLLKIATRRYWFRLSRYVYDGNRSFVPILRQRRWSLMYDAYWLDLMMMNSQQDRNTWTRFRVRMVLFLLNNE